MRKKFGHIAHAIIPARSRNPKNSHALGQRWSLALAPVLLIRNNLTKTPPEQGLTFGDTYNYSAEGAADLGGHILRDRLWFHGAYRYPNAEKQLAGYAR